MDKELKELLQDKMTEVNVLNVDKNSIVAIHLDMSDVSPEFIDNKVKQVGRYLKPLFDKKEVSLILCPFRGKKMATFEIIQKIKNEENK